MTCKTLNYVEHLLVLGSTFTVCLSISAFTSFVGIPVGIVSSARGLKVSVIKAGIKKYKSIIKNEKKKTNTMK